jgi:hypothetical protein
MATCCTRCIAQSSCYHKPSFERTAMLMPTRKSASVETVVPCLASLNRAALSCSNTSSSRARVATTFMLLGCFIFAALFVKPHIHLRRVYGVNTFFFAALFVKSHIQIIPVYICMHSSDATGQLPLRLACTYACTQVTQLPLSLGTTVQHSSTCAP